MSLRTAAPALFVVFASCASTEVRKSLEAVAKDWSMVIRASQVIPVYPLTEDLQPGDVFLVDTPVPVQARIYEQKGFLPLDQPVTRLTGLEYEEHYKRSPFWTPAYGKPDVTRPMKRDDPVHAPKAAFPSYNFSVESAGGLKLAIPIQGVPVGLGIMRAEAAEGSVTIDDAYTYGVGADTLLRQLRAWIETDPEVRTKLGELANTTDQTLYLRIVSRVYLTRGVTVSMVRTKALSGGVDAGVAQEIDLLSVQDKTTAENFKAATAAFQDALNAFKPGGSLRMAQASRRSVTLAEQFDRPLVVGYLGFDVPIGKDGLPGPPVATLAQLEGREQSSEVTRVGIPSAAQRQLDWRRLELSDLAFGPGGDPRDVARIVAAVAADVAQPGMDEVEARADRLARQARPPEAEIRALINDLWNAIAGFTDARKAYVMALIDGEITGKE